MPDAFIMDKNFSYDEQPQIPNIVDTDLTQFLAVFCLGIPNVYPLYLKNSFDNNNFYFGKYGTTYILNHYTEFERQKNFDNMPDEFYNGDLDLSNYVGLMDDGIS